MKHAWLFLLCVLVACGGRVDSEIATGVERHVQPIVQEEIQKVQEPEAPRGNEHLTTLAVGEFVGAGHDTTGVATVVQENGIQHITLGNFKVDKGPDLYVYLATDTEASNAINLGLLESFSGDQTYTVPGFVDVTEHKYVLIWCKAYSVLFGSAELA